MSQNENTASFLKALGHPVRLQIARELMDGEKCVSEVENTVNISQANTSQHLSILKVNGIVDCIRKGNVKCYFLKEPKKIQGLLSLLEDKIKEKG
ncbi:MAG TPA: metalloregulator ArsR/SmtB family transcription factor [Deltaproteobacteria bacterium]|nr:metalloregulator ArsR/SmtB family transcription factor [Deltaproteobacteria bacterium]HPJ94081.1 metalloregulator ArsR/SmtB family transcription factor [Deltaproteobacteria bacterium]HPR50964.1 metalloregulator ArsR/SmtB family transcription factor [Deltaproteobacteria bacterium]